MSQPTTPETFRLAYSPAEAAEILGVSRAHVHALIAQGILPSLKLGRSRRIRAEALAERLAILEAEAAS